MKGGDNGAPSCRVIFCTCYVVTWNLCTPHGKNGWSGGAMVCLRATLTSFIHVLPPFVASTLDVPPVSSHEAVPRSRFQTPEASPRRVPPSAIVHRPRTEPLVTPVHSVAAQWLISSNETTAALHWGHAGSWFVAFEQLSTECLHGPQMMCSHGRREWVALTTEQKAHMVFCFSSFSCFSASVSSRSSATGNIHVETAPTPCHAPITTR